MFWIAVLALMFGAIVVFSALAYVIDRMPAPLKEKLLPIFVVVVILYFAGGFGYAIYSAIFDPPAAPFEFEEYDDDCPGPPYAVC